MPDFTKFNDFQIIEYLFNHFDELDAGEPEVGLIDRLTGGISNNHLVIVKQVHAFAIIARANRKSEHPPGFPLLVAIPPEAKLLFLMVAKDARGMGVGSALVAIVKQRYMEGQEMTLECYGDARKHFFEKANFVLAASHANGQYDMVCTPQNHELPT